MFRRIGIISLTIITLQSFAQENLVIRSGTVFQGDSLIPIVTDIVVENGVIVFIGASEQYPISPKSRSINAKGKFVIPGLIEVHTHSVNKLTMEKALALGVTSGHTIPGTWGDTTLGFEIWASAPVNKSPRMIQNPWTFSGAYPDNISSSWYVVIPATPEEAIEAVEKVRNKGFLQIKIFWDTGRLWFYEKDPFPNLDNQTLRALINRAHQLNMRVFSHSWEARGYDILVDAGVDVVIHSPADSLLTNKTFRKMRSRSMPWVTTFSIIDRMVDKPTYARRRLQDTKLKVLLTDNQHKRAVADTMTTFDSHYWQRLMDEKDYYKKTIWENTQLAIKNGVQLALGSDCPIGIGTHIEMEILQEYGLTPEQILKAATVGSSLALGINNKTGTIQVGKMADLVILNSNPFIDIKNTRDVEVTIKEGIPFLRAELFREED